MTDALGKGDKINKNSEQKKLTFYFVYGKIKQK